MTAHRVPRLTAGPVLFLFALLAAGCDSGPRMIAVRGTVTLDGRPLSDGSVTFLDAATGAAAGGGAIRDGAFTVSVPEAAYKVQVFASRTVPGKTVPGMGDAPVLESIIPARYNSKTTLTADVTPRNTEIAFSLQSK